MRKREWEIGSCQPIPGTWHSKSCPPPNLQQSDNKGELVAILGAVHRASTDATVTVLHSAHILPGILMER